MMMASAAEDQQPPHQPPLPQQQSLQQLFERQACYPDQPQQPQQHQPQQAPESTRAAWQQPQQHQPQLEPQRERAMLSCPRELVGRIIGKSGTTVKGIQRFSGAVVDIDQTQVPSTIIIIGSPKSVQAAQSIINDIVAGRFKGFALLRQLVVAQRSGALHSTSPAVDDEYVYAPGFGLLPRCQLFAATAASNADGNRGGGGGGGACGRVSQANRSSSAGSTRLPWSVTDGSENGRDNISNDDNNSIGHRSNQGGGGGGGDGRVNGSAERLVRGGDTCPGNDSGLNSQQQKRQQQHYQQQQHALRFQGLLGAGDSFASVASGSSSNALAQAAALGLLSGQVDASLAMDCPQQRQQQQQHQQQQQLLIALQPMSLVRCEGSVEPMAASQQQQHPFAAALPSRPPAADSLARAAPSPPQALAASHHPTTSAAPASSALLQGSGGMLGAIAPAWLSASTAPPAAAAPLQLNHPTIIARTARRHVERG